MKPTLYLYRIHNTEGDDLGTVRHLAQNLELGDTVTTEDERQCVVTRYVETTPGSR